MPAEERLARYTFWLTVFTGALVAVSAVQGWLILRADKTARLAANAAKKSADETAKSVTLARENAERQLRAYVSLHHFTVTPRHAPGGQIARWDVGPEMQNTGLTPAHKARLNISFEVREDDLPADFDFAPIGANARPSTGSIGAGVKWLGESTPIDRGAVLQIAMLTHHGFIWGVLEYDDAFSPNTPTRHTRFAAEILVHGDPLGDDPGILSFRMLDRHNDAD